MHALGRDLEVTVGLAVALDVAVARLKACRASQAVAAEEAPMFERSEFGRRAATGEKRRGPMRLHRIGKRREQWFWLRLP